LAIITIFGFYSIVFRLVVMLSISLTVVPHFHLFSALQIGGSYWPGIPLRDWEKQFEE
jgi:hypothetical protein